MRAGSGSIGGPGAQAWGAFAQNHAPFSARLRLLRHPNCGFRMLYIFVVMEVGTRRILHASMTCVAQLPGKRGVNDPAAGFAVGTGHDARPLIVITVS